MKCNSLITSSYSYQIFFHQFMALPSVVVLVKYNDSILHMSPSDMTLEIKNI